MKYAHFHVPAWGGNQETRLNEFLRSHRVIQVERHFVVTGDAPGWAYLVYYEEVNPNAVADSVAERKPLVDYQELLGPADFAVYLKLRAWRKERAKAERVEAYTIFTNAQLAEIARRKCATLAALQEIEGVGEGRVEKHGEAVLEILRANLAG
ncbi:MAG: HRDC domain-containing protein [Verrucomicrobia bacterium]|nr:HRDC domain-containing protein [Verrucomicrobiota bacterium]